MPNYSKIMWAVIALAVVGCDKAKESLAGQSPGERVEVAGFETVELEGVVPEAPPVEKPSLEDAFKPSDSQNVCGVRVFGNDTFSVRSGEDCGPAGSATTTLYSADGEELATYLDVRSYSPQLAAIFVVGPNGLSGGTGAFVDLQSGEVTQLKSGESATFVEDRPEVLLTKHMGMVAGEQTFGIGISEEVPDAMPAFENQTTHVPAPGATVSWDESRKLYVFRSSGCTAAFFDAEKGESGCLINVPPEARSGRETLMTDKWFVLGGSSTDAPAAIDRSTGKSHELHIKECAQLLTVTPKPTATKPAVLLACGPSYPKAEQIEVWTPTGQFALPNSLRTLSKTHGNVFELVSQGASGRTQTWVDFEHMKLVDAGDKHLIGQNLISQLQATSAGTHELARYDGANHRATPFGSFECDKELEVRWHDDNLLSVGCLAFDDSSCSRTSRTVTWDFDKKKAWETMSPPFGFSDEYLYYSSRSKQGGTCRLETVQRIKR